LKNILPLFAIGILVLNGYGTVAITDNQTYDVKIENESIVISEPILKEIGNYISVSLEESTSILIHLGKPMLPVVTKVFTLPFGSKIKSVDVSFSEVEECSLPKEIQPSPGSIPMIDDAIMEGEPVKDANVYGSEELFPSSRYSYITGAGLDGEEHVIYLSVQCFPIIYSPGQNMIYYSETAEIDVVYEKPVTPTIFPNEYDLVIITPSKFLLNLLPLVRHKNKLGLSTMLNTTEKIYSEYDGRDKPEQIKCFIKDAVENLGVKYVILVGGMKNQRDSWYVPVRYSNLDDYSDWEASYISDLYYADIYKYNESSEGLEFEDWDSNGNGIFAEWNRNSTQKDILDLYPDVYIGRLACRNTREVKRIVKKIIKYETSTYGKNWFSKMILVAGDTFPSDSNEFEGEIETSRSASYMNSLGFDIIKLFTSDKTLEGERDVIRAISRGVGFIHFAGHGNPSVWATHPPHEHKWIDSLTIFGMDRLKNRYKLPICVVGGCHNSQFNVTVYNILKGLIKEGLHYFSEKPDDYGSFSKYEWVPECWSWKMISRRKTGSIAIIGNTGLGYGYTGNYTLEGLGGWIEPRFFHAYANQGKDILGETHGLAIKDYIDNFNVNSNRIDRKTVEQWVLLGDPSLKIGGYP